MIDDELHMTAELAMLEIDDRDRLAEAVEQMMDYFSTMMEMNVDDLEPTAHALLSGNRIREDIARQLEPVDALLEKAPEREDRFFRIPSIF